MKVNSGNEKDSTGEVLMIDPRRNMLKVKGLNRRKARLPSFFFGGGEVERSFFPEFGES